MTPERLQSLVDQFSSRRIAVIGDFFLDKYLDTDPTIVETSVETGKPAHQVTAVRHSPGAAGTVVNNLAALGVKNLYAVGAVGNDGEAFDLISDLQSLGCSTDGLLQFDSLMTPTYLKPRDGSTAGLAGEFERYDTRNRKPTPAEVSQAVLNFLEGLLPDLDAIIIADQVVESDWGIITESVRQKLSAWASEHPTVVFWADSRTHIRDFQNIIIKPNQFEAVAHQNPVPGEETSVEQLNSALPELRKSMNAPVCITLGEKGTLVSDPEPTHVPGIKLDGPLDTTGAGDSVTAGAVATLSAGATLPEAALIGNLVASITVQQLDTTGSATPEQLVDRLEVWREQNL